MNRRIFLSAAVAFATFAGVARADEFDDALKGIVKGVKDKSAADVKHFAGVLGNGFEKATPEQRKAFYPAMKQALAYPDKETKEAVVEALGKGDSRSVDPLQAEFDKAKDDVDLQKKCVAAIGKLKDPKTGYAFLKKLMNHKTPDVVAAAVDAFSNYKTEPFAARKDTVELLLKNYGPITSAADKPRPSQSERDKFEKTREPFENTLKALTGLSDKTGFAQWSKWWNDVGKKAESW
jgi:HEAT repeat protein